MPDNLMPLHDAARQSHDTARAMLASRSDAAATTDIISKLVDAAETAARASLDAAPGDTAARAVWQDICDLLAEDGLAPIVRCNRTGRRLYEIGPDGWLDHLTGIARLGDTASGDAARLRLLDSVLWQMGATTAPYASWTDPVALAHLRETSVTDYLCVTLQHVAPLPARAPSRLLAQRARDLGAARDAMERLPAPALQYAAECVTLYLSYVRPGDLPEADRLIRIENGPDFATIWQSPASLGHFCGRLIQTLTQLLARLSLRPAGQLGARDLSALRSQWRGHPAFAKLRQPRLAIRRDKRKAALVGRSTITPTMRARLAQLDDEANRLLAGVAADMLDTMDLAAALHVTGRPTTIAEADAIERDYLLSRAQRAKALRAYEARQQLGDGSNDDPADHDDDEADILGADLFDLSSMLLTGDLPADMLPEINSAADMVAMGLLDVDEIVHSAEAWSFDDDEADLEADPDWQADAIAAAMGDADARQPSQRRQPSRASRQPRQPSAADAAQADAIAEALSMLDGDGAQAPVPAQPASPAPIRRRVIGAAQSAPARLPEPAAPAAPVIRRRPLA